MAAKLAKKRSLPRRIARVVARVVAGLVVLVVLALIFIHTRWGKELVRARVEATLNQKVDGHVTLGSLDYGFLFDGIELGDLAIADRTGKPAIAVGSLHVDLDRGSLLGGAPVIDKLELSGLAVAVGQTKDGHSSLDHLVRPSDQAPLASIRISALAVSGSVTLVQPDGTTVELRDLAIRGSVDARPAANEVDAVLDQIAAQVVITRPADPTTTLPLALGRTTLSRRADAVAVDAHQLVIGAVSVDEISGHLGVVGSQLAGAQAVAITHARVDHRQLATQIGRDLLVDDVLVDATVSGPAKLLVIHGAVTTRTTSLTLDGTADVSLPAHPSYQLALVGRGASADLVRADAVPRVPAITTDLRVSIVGAGATPADLDAAITLDIGKTQVGAIAIDAVSVAARADRGTFTLERMSARGLGFEVAASGVLAADGAVRGRATVAGSPRRRWPCCRSPASRSRARCRACSGSSSR